MRNWKFPISNLGHRGNQRRGPLTPIAIVRGADGCVLLTFLGQPYRTNTAAVKMATKFCAEMNKAFSTDAEGGAERACGGMNMHEEYAMQWCTYDINGNPSWWTLTEWSRNLEVVNAQWEKFATRNDPVNPDLGHRLVKRMVSDPEIVEGGEA